MANRHHGAARRRLLLLAGLALLPAGPLAAQAVPDGASALRVPDVYRRTPSHRLDPFAFTFTPHWGFVVSADGSAANNALDVSNAIDLVLVTRQNGSSGQSRAANVMAAFGNVPPGAGVRGTGEAEGGVFLGGPITSHVHLGVSAGTRAYGGLRLDDSTVSLLSEGSAALPGFTQGASHGTALATVEAGAHAVVSLGPFGGRDGVHLALGFGGRFVRPAFYGRGDVVLSNPPTGPGLSIEASRTPLSSISDYVAGPGGAGVAADFLVRAEWPTNGFALEAMVANVGRVTVDGVENRALNLQIPTTQLDSVKARLDAATFAVTDTTNVDVTLPRIVRFAASTWANRILQIDVAATLPVHGDFEMPLTVEVGSTWRLVRAIPLRAGLLLGGLHGVGYTAGLAVESRVLYLDVSGESLGGLFSSAKGVGGHFALGFFF